MGYNYTPSMLSPPLKFMQPTFHSFIELKLEPISYSFALLAPSIHQRYRLDPNINYAQYLGVTDLPNDTVMTILYYYNLCQ